MLAYLHEFVTILTAQTANLQGNKKLAQEQYTEMLHDKSTEMIAIKGLLIQAREDGDIDKAIFLAKKAHGLNAKLNWPVTILIDLYKFKRNWDEIIQWAHTAKTKNMMPKDQCARIELVSLIAQACEASSKNPLTLYHQAYQIDPHDIPLILSYSRLLIKKESYKDAQKILLYTWNKAPDPILIAPLKDVIQKTIASYEKQKKKFDQLLNKHKISSYLATLAHAELAFDANNLDIARQFLQVSLSEHPSKSAYRLLIQIEQKQDADAESILNLQKLCDETNDPPPWHCMNCGHPHYEWSVHCLGCGAWDSLQNKKAPSSQAKLAQIEQLDV